MATKILTCKDCRAEFTFTEREQYFFGVHQWMDPVRCKECRKKNSRAKQAKRVDHRASRFARIGDVVTKHLGGNA